MNTRLLSFALLAASLAACSSIPERNSALDQARGRYETAQADPQVGALAPDELRQAGDALRVAEKAKTDGASATYVDHLAYVTSQRVTIAQETAWSKAAQAVTAGAAAERERMRLAQRTRETETVQAQLAMSRDSNARVTVELAQADAAVQRNRAELAQAEAAGQRSRAELALADAAGQRDRARLEQRDARVNDLEEQLRGLNARKTERGMVVTLGDVLFDSGQANLRGASAADMNKLADFFKRHPARTASIDGYTDSVGSSAANHELSGRRAQAVKTALVNLGVPADRLRTRAHGEEEPAASNDTAAGRQMNRRVEIVFTRLSDDVSRN